MSSDEENSIVSSIISEGATVYIKEEFIVKDDNSENENENEGSMSETDDPIDDEASEERRRRKKAEYNKKYRARLRSLKPPRISRAMTRAEISKAYRERKKLRNGGVPIPRKKKIVTTVPFSFRGLIVPVFSPFNNDEHKTLNLSIIPEYAKFLSSKNINGILVNGTTGEGTCLSVDERKQVAEAWVAAVKETKQHLMIQVGGAALSDVKELAAHAEKIGVDSILCLPELYFKPSNVDELTDYLRTVGKSAPKTPLLYYHIPMFTGVKVHMGEFLESVGSKIPTFCGIKFTSNDLAEGYQAMTANKRFAVFVGSDVLMSAGCTLGMDSFIMTSLNFIPEPALELLEFGKGNRDLKIARENQERICKIVKAVTLYGNWVETMKIAMNLTTNLFMGPPRAPLNLLKKNYVEAMAKGLTEAGLNVDTTAVMKMY